MKVQALHSLLGLFIVRLGGGCTSMGNLRVTNGSATKLRRRSTLLPVVLALCLIGCTSAPERRAVPAHLTAVAEIPGFPRVRAAPGDGDGELYADLSAALRRRIREKNGLDLLALSGGGANGAFGAGLLCGWDESGRRPEFDVITGVSTGALIAPFAFIGKAGNDYLRENYTKVTDADVFQHRSYLGILRRNSLLIARPLERNLGRMIDAGLLARIAEEHAKGRRLFAVTTDFDAQRPVVWDLGQIASIGSPEAAALFRKVLIASASIPVAFPPQFFSVHTPEGNFEEMHVDGGMITQVMIRLNYLAATRDAAAIELGRPVPVRVYIVRNAKASSEHHPVANRLPAILGRTLQTITRMQGIDDLQRIYFETRQFGFEYRLAYVPPEFPSEYHGSFDPQYMQRLFESARAAATDGYPWVMAPPFFDDFNPNLVASGIGAGSAISPHEGQAHGLNVAPAK